MRNKLLLFTIAFAIGAASMSAFGRSLFRSHPDDFLYNKIVQVRGKVTILDPKLGQIAGTGQYLVFQREGCKECLIGTRANADGEYEVFLGRGRYRIIMREVEGNREGNPSHDLLAPDQPRYVDAQHPGVGEVFNINMVFPKDH